MNETLETMWQRRSVRRYRPDPIPEEHLRLILEAARRAPTGANRQNWRKRETAQQPGGYP